jgi:hypothetical protein
MHSALFVAVDPTDRTKVQNWRGFLSYADSHTDPTKGAERLAENVWLLNLQVSLAPLGELIACAEAQTISYRILPFERAPEWLPVVPDPTSTLGQNAQP